MPVTINQIDTLKDYFNGVMNRAGHRADNVIREFDNQTPISESKSFFANI